MTMRLRSSRAPTRNGVNSALILSSPYSMCSAAREKSHDVSKEHTRTTRGPGQAGVLVTLLINWSMREKSLTAYRSRIIPAAEGRVLEIGIGSGLNLLFYSRNVTHVIGLEPSPRLLAMARRAERAEFGPVAQ